MLIGLRSFLDWNSSLCVAKCIEFQSIIIIIPLPLTFLNLRKALEARNLGTSCWEFLKNGAHSLRFPIAFNVSLH